MLHHPCVGLVLYLCERTRPCAHFAHARVVQPPEHAPAAWGGARARHHPPVTQTRNLHLRARGVRPFGLTRPQTPGSAPRAHPARLAVRLSAACARLSHVPRPPLPVYPRTSDKVHLAGCR